MSDGLDEIYDLRDELDREQQRLAAGAAVSGVATGSDEHGAVTVEFDTVSGTATVNVADSWRSSYEPEELGATIVRVATEAATAQRMQTWEEQVPEPGTAPTRPLPKTSDTAVGRLVEALESGSIPQSTAAVSERLVEMITELNRGLDETFAIVRSRAAQGYSGRTFGGNTVVTIDRSGLPVSIVFSEAWLATAHARSIGAEVNAALEIAREARDADAAAGANPLAGTPLERFAGLATDPDALIRLIKD